ncbi:MAG: selenium-dependent xanthine dehydrogenase [Desulfobacula sp.]|uniref:selenium-dependent xanthine dehydrogenase n=1 Tax=Desulfobacula sp. TaxID=2593537 RepID=UPI0025C55FB3|nr:selenium-dependent xanthine dehydrogenase [Desulfobacula sp.]MCD4719675.1 selenium-dependent xanthine dehydrogenase [Desulfobacula sp.]
MIKFTLNQTPISFKGSKELSLLTWLREEMNIVSVKNGCSGQGACGACLLEINGKPALSCRTPMKKLDGADIVTIEGFDPVLKDTLAKAFVKKGAVQCGFCTPGFLSRAKILLEQNASPSREEIKKAFSANLCRCTGYTKIIDAVILAAESLKSKKKIELLENAGVGQSRAKHDAYLTALGRRNFIDDMKFPGMLFSALRFSNHPRAKVLCIHTRKAAKLPGVVRVFTAEDIPGEKMTGAIHQDWPLMVQEGETTRYIGDVLAGVVAEDEKTARRACNLIEVEYEVLEPVTDPVEALTDKIKVHEKGNLLAITQFSRGGNIDDAFESSAFTVSAQYRTQLVEHAFLETEAAIAKPHGKDGIQIYTQSQGIYEDRHSISKLLGIPKERVIATLVPCGGAFGGKEDLTVQGHAALFSFHLNQIIKLRLSREESIRMHVKRHPFIMNYKLGCDRKGKLTALFADIIGDTGAYASLGGEVLNRAAGHAAGGFHVPVVDVISKAVYTNNLPSGAMRGFGVNQVTFAMECIVDELCGKGGFDPWQFRFDNALEKGSMTTTGQVLGDGVGLKETLLAVKEEFYNAKYAGIAIAIKNIGFGNGLVDESEAVIEIISDKKVILHHGWTEMGQGVDTIAKQILYDVAGLKDVRIDVVSSTDSEVIGGTTTASRGTFLLGNSLIMAANKLKTELAKCELKDLVGKKFKGRWFCDWTTRPGNNVENPQTHFAYGYAAQVVILDEKGCVEKVVAAHDAGRVINPALFEGQVQGAVMMGLGYAFTEKLALDNGRLVSSKMAKLGVPKIKSMPEIIVKVVEVKDPGGPMGAKGVGEIGLVPTAPAAVNALFQFDKKRRYELPVGQRIK